MITPFRSALTRGRKAYMFVVDRMNRTCELPRRPMQELILLDLP